MDFEGLYQTVSGFTLLDVERIRSLWHLINDVRGRGIKGDIVECGCSRGGSSAVLRMGMGPNRQLWLYDSFQGMPETSEINGDETKKYVGTCAASVEDVLRILTTTGAKTEEFLIMEGLFQETFQKSLPEKVALLHCDADWYESVSLVLETFYPLIPDRGLRYLG